MLMQELNIGMVPVCSGSEIQGTVTDRDIVVRVVAYGNDPASTLACHIMSLGVIYCYEDMSLQDATALMEDHKVRRLLVKDRQGRLVGVVSLGDIAAAADDGVELSGEALSEISRPYPLHMSEDESMFDDEFGDASEAATVTSGYLSWQRRELMDSRY